MLMALNGLVCADVPLGNYSLRLTQGQILHGEETSVTPLVVAAPTDRQTDGQCHRVKPPLLFCGGV